MNNWLKAYHVVMVSISLYFIVRILLQISYGEDYPATILLLLLNLNVWVMTTKVIMDSERRKKK